VASTYRLEACVELSPGDPWRPASRPSGKLLRLLASCMETSRGEPDAEEVGDPDSRANLSQLVAPARPRFSDKC
jgi:hypothetical protein